ncbi:MAG TPA: UDP-N-acetylglucosamine 1-carboxyvinyltransferase [Alphaproteobacteria bacterium]|nr:UDP-N-acetylglucosamine 1-carboxyvinyltransferase [Alphaproteobacteria bacterium]
MDKIQIKGGNRLNGELKISGAKNAALPLMVASLLSDEPLTLTNVPHLTDISQLTEILCGLGVDLVMNGDGHAEAETGRVITLTARNITSTFAPYDLVRKMRASFLVIGPLLARCHQAQVSLPGGCAIGTRPVDLHLKGLEAMGAEIELIEGYVHAKAPGGLKGAHFHFPFVSVGATENLMMAASLAKGTTVLENAAQEPEITDLGLCLMAMGAKISGLNTRTLTIEGVDRLNGTAYRVMPDRIETGTYLMAVAAAGGEVELIGARSDLIGAVIPLLSNAGVKIGETNRGIKVSRNGAHYEGVEVTTEPYPGFPTDLQAQLMALVCTAKGTSRITETIFENRFMHAPELLRMGADIAIEHQTAVIRGVERLKGAQVMATDLRASVGLVIAGLAAEGETTVNRVYHLDRGFERIEEKLGGLGADIRRIKG